MSEKVKFCEEINTVVKNGSDLISHIHRCMLTMEFDREKCAAYLNFIEDAIIRWKKRIKKPEDP